jgi:hypothetical protein
MRGLCNMWEQARDTQKWFDHTAHMPGISSGPTHSNWSDRTGESVAHVPAVRCIRTDVSVHQI